MLLIVTSSVAHCMAEGPVKGFGEMKEIRLTPMHTEVVHYSVTVILGCPNSINGYLCRSPGEVNM